MPDRPDLDELERLREAATPGPWEWSGRDIDGPDFSTVLEVQDLPAHAYPEMQTGELVIGEADKSLIVAAVNALPFLLAEARKGRKTLGRQPYPNAAEARKVERLTKERDECRTPALLVQVETLREALRDAEATLLELRSKPYRAEDAVAAYAERRRCAALEGAPGE